MRLGLRGKILLIASVVVVAAMGAIAMTSSYFVTEHSTRSHVSRSTAIAKGLALQLERILALGIEVQDLQGFEQQCAEAVSAYAGLSYAMVVANDGRVLFHNDPAAAGKPLSSAVLRATLRGAAAAPVDAEDGSHAVTAPVRDAGKNTLAHVFVGFPEDVVRRERNELLVQTLAVGTGALVIGLALLFLALSHNVVRPLSDFMGAIERIRSGAQDYAARLKAAGGDEIGIMVSGFNNLLDRIAERERELVTAREAAEAANTAKTQFLAMVSHELRTPLNAVLGMNELLLGTPMSEKQQRYARHVDTAGRALLGVINDLLDFSRIEAGKLDIVSGPFDLRTVIGDTVEMFREPARAKGLTLSLSVDPALQERVTGDSGRTAQILSNLVNNAIKFTDHGSISVTVSPTRDGIRFAVSDTGIGIDPDFIDHIYEAFRQQDSSYTRRYGGTGLGLTIVKQLADALGGSVGVSSRRGTGSTFWVDLPLPAAPDRAAAQSGPAEAAGAPPPSTVQAPPFAATIAGNGLGAMDGSARRRILLAEDNDANQELVRLFLEDTRYDLTVEGTGADALTRFTREAFDAVLMDWQIPTLDGIETTLAIRDTERAHGRKRTPIIAVTAHAQEEHRAACHAAGMDDYLAKPFGRDALLAVLDRWTGQASDSPPAPARAPAQG